VGARVHINSDELLPRQDVLFCAVYKHKKKQVPFWEAKTLLTRIMGELKCAYQLTIPQALKPWQHPLRTAEVHCQEKIIGSVFEIHPLVLEKYGIEGAVSVVELNLSSMEQMMYKISMVTTYQPVSEYPEMMRDIALMVKEEVSHQNLQEVLMKQDPLIKSVQLFDVYIGAPIKSGYKSMAYRITYSRHDRTLTTQEVDEVQSKIHAVLKKEFDAELRS
jgi:phenylalanyl-tRNA synthetase beta chain